MGSVTVQISDDAGKIRSLAEIENEVIATVLAICAGNMSEAARLLEIGRSTIYRKIDAAPTALSAD